MLRRLRWPLLYGCLLLALAGCTISTYSGVTAPPCATQTAAAATASPTPSLGTRTTGSAIVITTDRTVYAPLDGIHVTITNRIHASAGTQGTLVLVPPGLGCPQVWAQRLQGSVWEGIRVCSPSGGGEANLGDTGEIPVPPDETFAVFVAAPTDRSHPHQQDPFPTGVYRIAVQYYLAVHQVVVIRYGMAGGFTAYSQPFRVCTCGVCA